MSHISRPRAWASCIACLAMAVVTGSALAQQQEQQTSDQTSSQSASQAEQQNQEQERQRQQQEQQRTEQQQQEQQQQGQQQDRQRGEQDQQRDQQAGRDRQDQQRDQQTQRDQQARQRDRQTRQRDRQDRDRDQQARSRDQQDRQRDQQTRQWSQQDRQRTGQTRREDDRFRGRTQDEWSRFPEPGRERQFSRDSQRSGQYDVYSERQSRQFDSGDQEDAGLGVNIISEGGEGVTVVRVFQDTPAEQMGIEEGDRITEVNGQQVRSTQEFISRIRNMNPGDEVQIAIDRDREQFTVNGQLESREEALARNQQRGQSWQQEDETWQTGYEDRTGYQQQQGRMARGGDSEGRIQQIEQQVNRISQQLDQLRNSLRQLRQAQGGQQYGRSGERQAGYDEDQGGYQEQQRFQSDEPSRSNQRIQQRRSIQIDEGRGSIQSDGFRANTSDTRGEGYRSDEGGYDSPGGVTGGLRTRPDNDPNWERR